MHRRAFLQCTAMAPAALAAVTPDIPQYKIVTPYRPDPHAGLPGKVVSIHSERSIDAQSGKADPEMVRKMMDSGMTALTGERTPADAWRRFITPQDIVGIKVNC